MKKTSKIIIISSVVLFLAIVTVGPYLFFAKNKKPNYQTAIVTKGDITQEVSSTGNVKPSSEVELSFERGGKTARVYYQVGDRVPEGAILVAQDASELNTQLAQYQAALDKAQADLISLEQGTKPEEIQLAETKYQAALQASADAEKSLTNVQNKADIDLANAYDDAQDTIREAYYYADDAINKQIDALFNNDNTDNPTLTFSVSQEEQKRLAESQRVLARNALVSFAADMTSITSADNSQIDAILVRAEGYLNIIRAFLTNLSDALNASIGLSSTTLNTYKGYVNAARTNVNTALSNTNNQKQAIVSQKATNQTNIDASIASVNTAKNNLKIAQDELTLKKSPATAEQIAASQAQVDSAQANVDNIKAQITKTYLISPIAGIVTKQLAKVGEIVSAQTLVASVISDAGFEIETFIPEVDIAKVEIGDIAKVTLDAYSDDIIFTATVSKVDPAETILEGVATYKTTLQFLEKNEKVKSGMTANIDILTAQKENVLYVPVRAIIDDNGETFVKVIKDKQVTEQKVETGLRGSFGNIEIISGLAEGEKIITSSNGS